MLDIKYIRENADKVQEDSKNKGYKVDIAKLLQVDDARRALQQEVDMVREQRNAVAAKMKDGKPSQELIDEGKKIKEKLSGLEQELRSADSVYQEQLGAVPNILLSDVPIGDEDKFEVVRTFGATEKSAAIDHLDFALKRDWVDFERGAKVAGTKFYYLKKELALLEMALIQYGIKKITEFGFSLMDVPYLVNERVAAGTGFAPRSDEQTDSYFIEGEDLTLIGTAEAPLTGFHMDEIIDAKDLPLLYAGYSPCWRKEAGAAGKHARGLFRVHQFNKLEMYAYTLPEQSAEIHEKILAAEEEIWQKLGLPYRVINIASGDLGAPAAKKYDIEYWSPVDGAYRELTSCSNCTDYQARNLNIRTRRQDGQVEVVHTLNGTAISLARALVAIIENFQQGDKLVVPEVLRPYLGDKEEL